MTTQIPESFKDLLSGPVVVAFATVMPDGSPQVTPVWCDFDGENIIVNTAAGRRKDRNVRANPKVNVLAIDPQNPYRWIEIRGTVTNITEEGGLDTINKLAKIYTGADSYYGGVSPEEAQAKETRVNVIITPDKVNTSN